jgi:hypothetical protein
MVREFFFFIWVAADELKFGAEENDILRALGIPRWVGVI